jgi:hydrogenase nickel incorporation protein HypA/HybF
MDDLMRKIMKVAQENGALRVKSINVRLGALTHFSEEHFIEHFNRSALGSIAEKAELHILISHDIKEPHAQDILLESVEVES